MITIKKIKGIIKSRLEKSDKYLRVRHSPFFTSVWLLFRKDSSVKLNSQKFFYNDLLRNIKPGASVIFDIGANEGFTTNIFASLAGKTIAIDPSPLNARILRQKFYRQKKVLIFEAAVANISGREKLYMEKGTALHTLNPMRKKLLESEDSSPHTAFIKEIMVTTITIPELISKFGLPVFIKIDTEGYENKIITGITEPIPQIYFEAILPVFMEETISCIRHLQKVDQHAVFNIAVKSRLINSTFIDADTIISMLPSISQSTDIICRMGNYSDYYS